MRKARGCLNRPGWPAQGPADAHRGAETEEGSFPLPFFARFNFVWVREAGAAGGTTRDAHLARRPRAAFVSVPFHRGGRPLDARTAARRRPLRRRPLWRRRPCVAARRVARIHSQKGRVHSPKKPAQVVIEEQRPCAARRRGPGPGAARGSKCSAAPGGRGCRGEEALQRGGQGLMHGH